MRLSLYARMALILLAGLLSAQLASLWLHWDERATMVTQTRGQHLVDRIAEVIRVLESEPAPLRPSALRAFQSDDLRVSAIEESQVSLHAPRGQLPLGIAARLGSEREVRSVGSGGGGGKGGGKGSGKGAQAGMRILDVRLDDGQWIRISIARESEAPTPALPFDFFVHLLISLVVVTGVGMIAVRQVTRPLQQLAQAADSLGSNLDAPPLAEEGPAETRQAAQAFNRMQQSIRRLISERARALSAVSHDLRTPLTRLRLRAELIDDEDLRNQIADDIDAMTGMIDSTLDYLRGLQESEAIHPLDINALLQSLVNDAAVLGREIDISGQALAPFPGRLTALRRALQNLIDNAIKYGHGAHLSVIDDTDSLRLTVSDDGPGIAEEELSRVTEPYYRPDAARRSETGGVGLGLSIVSDIARLHGGELQLRNRPEGGLAATLVLRRR